MKIQLLIVIFCAVWMLGLCQSDYQSFSSAGFKIKCPCTLKTDSKGIQVINQEKLIGLYTCKENWDTEYAAINHINIYDESKDYERLLSSEVRATYERVYLEKYASLVAANGGTYKYVKFKGVTALEYSQSQQMDDVLIKVKAIIFLKNRKSYIIQVMGKNVDMKFNSLKMSFEFL